MGTTHQSPSKFRRQSPELMRQRFLWLDQVLIDPELPASAFKIAYRIGDGFNDVQHDGRAWESSKKIGIAIGMSEPTVIAMVRRLHARGHLRIDPGQQGRGHSNSYWLILKPQPADVSDEIKPQPAERKPQPADMNQDTNEGSPYGAAERESVAAPPPSGGPAPKGPPHRGRKDGTAGRSASPSGSAGGDTAVPRSQELATLRGVWVRKAHTVKDNKSAEIKAEQRALDDALQSGVPFDVIVAAAKTWTAAYDPENNGRRYLPSLLDWLSAKGWGEPPPKRKQVNGHARGNGRRRRSSGKTTQDAIAERIKQRIYARGGLQ